MNRNWVEWLRAAMWGMVPDNLQTSQEVEVPKRLLSTVLSGIDNRHCSSRKQFSVKLV